MANGDEEEKSFGQKLLSTFLRGAGRLPQVGIRPSGIPGVPTTGYGAPLTSGTAGPPNPMQRRAQAGIDAREQVKASSMAADRRNERMMKGTASPVTRDFSNDPIDW